MTAEMGLICVTAVAMLLDVLTGLAKGAATVGIDSTKMREGLWHKAGFVGLVALAYVLQIAQGFAELGVEIPTVGAVCVFIVLTEAVSILENLCELNPAIADSPVGRLFSGKTDAQ